jgi:haloalkane dehalogenase
MSEASLEQNMAAARHEHLIPGREIHMQGMRGHPFCEVGLITGTTPDNAIANIWNTTGVCEPTPEQFDALDAGTIARENEAQHAWLNPVRHWMFDRLDVREAGDYKTFGGIIGTWMGVAPATLTADAVQGSYEPTYIHNDAVTFTFNKGKEVYVLDAPDGEMFVLQSFTRRSDATMSERDLAHLYRRLELPDGWGFRAVVLEQDMEVTPSADSLAHVLQDDLQNVYQGSDLGRAFSNIWPANPPGYAV